MKLPDFLPVILSGGSGTRLWPLSRKSYPKQLLPLIGDRSMLQQTALRLADRGRTPLIITNDEHRFVVRQQLQEIGVDPVNILLEPVGRNTASAVALACLEAERNGDPVVGVFPSDHLIADEAAFQEALARAFDGAAAGWIVTFSITPTRPDTGFGYIRRGAELSNLTGVFDVASFVEKPDATAAAAYLATGSYGWNGGVFVFRASVMRAELQAHAPDVWDAARDALASAAEDLGFYRLDHDAFAAAPSIAIDVAVMERTDKAATVPVEMGWSDLGSWKALHDAAPIDASGNATHGRSVVRDCSDSYVRAEDGRLIAAVGLRDTVVVSTADAVFVSPIDRAPEVKELVAQLDADAVPEASTHRRVARPWGSYEDIDRSDNFRVKRIIVAPGGRLSLQRHRQRSEHWVVVRGSAHVTIDGIESELSRNQSTFVPIGALHRLENRGSEPLHLIEVQVGDYVEEDDIERLDDQYGRG